MTRALDAALAAYERERRPINAGLLRWSHFMGRFFAMRGAVGTELRARVFALGGNALGQWIQRRVWSRVATRPGHAAPATVAPRDRAVARLHWSRSRERPRAAPCGCTVPPRAPAPRAASRWILSPLPTCIWFQGSVLAGVALLVFFMLAPPLAAGADRDAAGAAGAAAVGDPVRRHPRRRHLRAQLPRARSAARAGLPGVWSLALLAVGPLAAVADRAAGGVAVPLLPAGRAALGLLPPGAPALGLRRALPAARAGRSDAGAARRGVPLARLPLPVRALLAHAGVRGVGPAAAAARRRDGAGRATSLDGAVALAAVGARGGLDQARRRAARSAPSTCSSRS